MYNEIWSWSMDDEFKAHYHDMNIDLQADKA